MAPSILLKEEQTEQSLYTLPPLRAPASTRRSNERQHAGTDQPLRSLTRSLEAMLRALCLGALLIAGAVLLIFVLVPASFTGILLLLVGLSPVLIPAALIWLTASTELEPGARARDRSPGGHPWPGRRETCG
jgi:hypothetical protein